MLYFTVKWNINAWIFIFQWPRCQSVKICSSNKFVHKFSNVQLLNQNQHVNLERLLGLISFKLENGTHHSCLKTPRPHHPSRAPWDTGGSPEQLLQAAEEEKGPWQSHPAPRSTGTLLPPPWTMEIYHNELQINTNILNLPQESQILVSVYVYKLYWYLGFWGWFFFFPFLLGFFLFLHFTMHSTDLVQYSSNCKCINFHLSFLA